MADSVVLHLIEEEQKRQNENVELIASENFVSENILKALGSCLTNKYSEGYPTERLTGNKGRYYGGCQVVDEIEEYCCNAFRNLFNTHYHVNVQPHSGSQANYAAYMAVLKPGDTILSMELNNGGHLTHGSSANFSGKLYNVIFYGVDSNGYIDYEDFEKKIRDYKPNLILAGASAYPREIDFEKMSKIIETICIEDAYDFINNQQFDHEGNCINPNESCYNPIFMVDMAHIAGLVATGFHKSPFGYADIITTTTHKTLRGPRGGLIFCKPSLAKKVDSAVFPGSQGGPLQNVIAAKAICAEEARKSEFTEYIRNVVTNCAAMCEQFKKLGYDIITGGTDNHLFMIDLSKTNPNLTGKMVQDELDRHKITLNKNCVPNEKRSPMQASGLRIGTAAMTTKGWGPLDFIGVADEIDRIIKNMEVEYGNKMK